MSLSLFPFFPPSQLLLTDVLFYTVNRLHNRSSLYRIKPTVYEAVKAEIKTVESGGNKELLWRLTAVFEEIVKEEENIDPPTAIPVCHTHTYLHLIHCHICFFFPLLSCRPSTMELMNGLPVTVVIRIFLVEDIIVLNVQKLVVVMIYVYTVTRSLEVRIVGV